MNFENAISVTYNNYFRSSKMFQIGWYPYLHVLSVDLRDQIRVTIDGDRSGLCQVDEKIFVNGLCWVTSFL